MSTLAAASEVVCRMNAERTYDRAVGRCSADGVDLGLVLIQAGLCGRCLAYDRVGYYASIRTSNDGSIPRYCTAL